VGVAVTATPKGHPTNHPALRIIDHTVYPTFGSPRDQPGPCFDVFGSFVYAVGLPGAPWFHIRARTHGGGGRIDEWVLKK